MMGKNASSTTPSRCGKRFLLSVLLILLALSPRTVVQAIIIKKSSALYGLSQKKLKPIRLNTRQLKLSLDHESSLLQTRGGGRRNAPVTEETGDSNHNEDLAAAEAVSASSGASSEDGDEIKVISGGATGDNSPTLEEDVSSSESESDAATATATTESATNPLGKEPLANESSSETLEEGELIEQASQLRQQGKASHDEGDFAEAAAQFHKAANLLERCLTIDTSSSDSDSEDTVAATANFQDEWATCRLHESLCHLKAEDYEGCVSACTSLLDSEDAAAMIRARAHHRRAKAKVALGDMDGALVDARSAAFLGDRKAVAYYGKLMRETGSSTTGDPLLPSSSSCASPSPFADSSSLLESLLNKSGPNPSQNSGNNLLASSLLNSLGGPGMGPNGLSGNGAVDGGGGLAKSVLKSLSKRLEDESTHDGICRYLQSTSPVQLQSMAQMAGVELSSNQAAKIVQIAHGITPKTIQKTVKNTKRAVWSFQLVRKTTQLISKYKNVLFLLMLVQWTRSAIVRPIPTPKVKAPRRSRVKAASKPKAQANVGAGGIL